jgi:hypothetical protein
MASETRPSIFPRPLARRVHASRNALRRVGFPAILARLGLWLAAFALLAQSLAVAAPPPAASDAHSAAATLSALLGPGVVICAQSDDHGAPHSPHDCCDQCPLCRLVANAATLSPPTAEPLPAPALIVVGSIGFTAQQRSIPPPPPGFSLARGPPSRT